MNQQSERTVCFVGRPGAVEKTLNDTLMMRGMRLRIFNCVDHGRGPLRNGRCDLVLIDFNGDISHSLGLLAELQQLVPQVPKVALVAEGDIPTAVQAIKEGAAHCLEKPIEAQDLCSKIQDLIDEVASDLSVAILTLTRMETTVLRLIVDGLTSREIARALHRSPRTIEVHRSHIMHKLDVSNSVELLRTAAAMGLFQ